MANQEPRLHLVLCSSCVFVTDVAAHVSLPERSGSVSKTMWSGCWQLLCIAIAAFLLCRAGDVEMNPGPECKCIRSMHEVESARVNPLTC